MKARTLIAAGTIALSGLVAVPAMASLSTGNLGVDIQSAVGSDGRVSVKLDDGVATLWGNVDNAGTQERVRQAALANSDVERVIDLVAY